MDLGIVSIAKNIRSSPRVVEETQDLTLDFSKLLQVYSLVYVLAMCMQKVT